MLLLLSIMFGAVEVDAVVDVVDVVLKLDLCPAPFLPRMSMNHLKPTAYCRYRHLPDGYLRHSISKRKSPDDVR